MTARFEFIDGEKANYPLVRMFDWLEVSSSGYYDWRTRPASATAQRRADLKAVIQVVFDDSDGTYGHRRVHAGLARLGVEASAELVRSLMREMGLVACQPRPWRTTTIADGAPPADHCRGDFTAAAPGVKLVGDITYVRTWAGWLYLATVIDCHTKAVVGWAMAPRMDARLVVDAIAMAARHIEILPGCVFHSDRGSQYTSAVYRDALAEHGIMPSVGRTGVCWDNAMAESFFAALKNELVHRTAFPTREHARRAIARYIELFYNRKRLHSGLGYKTPHEAHIEYLQRQVAA